MKKRILTDTQNEIASRLQAALQGSRPEDGILAMLSIIAATTNHMAPSPQHGVHQAQLHAETLVDIAAAGARGELIRDDETDGFNPHGSGPLPIEPREG